MESTAPNPTASALAPTQKPTLTLHPATLSDIPQISNIWFSAFSDAFLQRMFPPTPAVQKWWDETNSHDLQYRSADHFLVIKINNTDKVIAYAKWQCPTPGEDKPSPEEFFPRFRNQWPQESDGELCDRFFDTIRDVRLRYFEGKGERQHFYLDMLATHPDYRKLGAGSMLVEWGTKRAEEAGKIAYVDASAMGAPVYEHCGFEKLDPIEMPGETFTCTAYARMPKK